MICASLTGFSVVAPLLASATASSDSLIAELAERVAAEPRIVYRLRAGRGLTYCERLLAEPEQHGAMVDLIDLCHEDLRATTLVLGTLGLKNLGPEVAFDILQKGLAAGMGRTELLDIAESLLIGGERRERVVAAYEGREWVDPASQPIPEIPIVTELQYTPSFHPDFPPLKMTLQRQGKDCPLIIERVTYTQAERMLSGTARDELQAYVGPEKVGDPESLILLGRTFDGEVQAISIAYLVSYDEMCLTLQWDRARKIDQNKGTHIAPIGLAMLIAQLRYMKQKDYWYDEGEIAFNIDLAMLNGYRDRYNSPRSSWWPSVMMTQPIDGVRHEEAEFFLSLPDFAMQPVA